jgi:hypothetical protein
MEFGDIQTIISKAIEQTKSDQIVPLMTWLDGEISRFRVSGLCKYCNYEKTKILFIIIKIQKKQIRSEIFSFEFLGNFKVISEIS